MELILTLSLYSIAARLSPDCFIIKQGIIQCTAAITRVLDTQNCFSDASATISVNSVLKCLKKPPVPKGMAKQMALDKFKGLKNPKPKSNENENLAKLLKADKNKKKKKDPLDPDKDFLKELIKELDTTPSKTYVSWNV